LKQAAPLRNRLYDGSAPGWLAVSRGAALGLSCLLVLNLLEVFVYSTSAVENWFTNLQPLTQPVGITVLAMAATALVMFSLKPALPGPVWFASVGTVVLLGGFCGRELWQISQSVPESQRTTAMARPLGIVMLLAAAGIGIVLGNAGSLRGRSSILMILFSSILAIAGFAVVTIQSGGVSDPLPTTEVPVILTFGNQLEADGNPSEALADRVATASRLLLEKHGRILVLSGAFADGPVARTDAMQELAIAAGVAETSIVLDPNVSQTATSIRFAGSLPEVRDNRHIMGVSHWYELARIRLLARRSGMTVSAVAAEQEHALFNQNMLVAREVLDLLNALCQPAIEFGRGFLRPADDPGDVQ
jgi:vancomycin permeability regulator SanA